jgi:rhodanese-related sulfurtransferase
MYEDGFENVSALVGGFEEWINAGYPVEKSEE